MSGKMKVDCISKGPVLEQCGRWTSLRSPAACCLHACHVFTSSVINGSKLNIISVYARRNARVYVLVCARVPHRAFDISR